MLRIDRASFPQGEKKESPRLARMGQRLDDGCGRTILPDKTCVGGGVVITGLFAALPGLWWGR